MIYKRERERQCVFMCVCERKRERVGEGGGGGAEKMIDEKKRKIWGEGRKPRVGKQN